MQVSFNKGKHVSPSGKALKAVFFSFSPQLPSMARFSVRIEIRTKHAIMSHTTEENLGTRKGAFTQVVHRRSGMTPDSLILDVERW